METKIPSRLHNLISYGGATFLGIYLSFSYGFSSSLQTLIFFLWLIHFLKRIFEVLFIHKYGKQVNLIADAIPEYAYYWLFGLWILNSSLSLDFPIGISQYLGIFLWIVGESGNFYSHLLLSRLKPNEKVQKKQIPKGFLFEFISCPHYLFEITSWIGFAFVCQTLASWIFLIAVFLILLWWAHERHLDYLKNFPNYPKSRKRVIPFLF